MRHPILAMIWQSWRLSRRWYLLILSISMLICWLILNAEPRPAVLLDPREFQLFQGNNAVFAILGIAGFSTLLTISTGSKDGFPFSFEFRLPASSFILTAAPMLFLGLLSASLYFIPLAVYRVLVDIPFPLLPGSVLVFTYVLILLCCTWTVSNKSVRWIAIEISTVFFIVLMAWFKPISLGAMSPEDKIYFSANVLSLDRFEYFILLFVSFLLLVITVSGVSKKRFGESAQFLERNQQGGEYSSINVNRIGKAFSPTALTATVKNKMAINCPTTKAWHAEVWYEFSRHVIPVVLLCIALTLSTPVLFLLGAAADWRVAIDIPRAFPFIIFFVGVGLAIINRRQAHGGYFNVFEGSRSLSTGQLASVQIFTIAIVTAMGMALVNTSLSLSDLLLGDFSGYSQDFPRFIAPLQKTTFLLQLNNYFLGFVVHTSIIAAFSCLHSCSVLWGRKFQVLTVVLILAAITMISRVLAEEIEIQAISILIWSVSILITAVTIIVMLRILWLQVISKRSALNLVMAWTVFFVSSFFNLGQRGYDFPTAVPALSALNFALLLLPLMLWVLTLWCYARLRHA